MDQALRYRDLRNAYLVGGFVALLFAPAITPLLAIGMFALTMAVIYHNNYIGELVSDEHLQLGKRLEAIEKKRDGEARSRDGHAPPPAD